MFPRFFAKNPLNLGFSSKSRKIFLRFVYHEDYSASLSILFSLFSLSFVSLFLSLCVIGKSDPCVSVLGNGVQVVCTHTIEVFLSLFFLSFSLSLSMPLFWSMVFKLSELIQLKLFFLSFFFTFFFFSFSFLFSFFLFLFLKTKLFLCFCSLSLYPLFSFSFFLSE